MWARQVGSAVAGDVIGRRRPRGQTTRRGPCQADDHGGTPGRRAAGSLLVARGRGDDRGSQAALVTSALLGGESRRRYGLDSPWPLAWWWSRSGADPRGR